MTNASSCHRVTITSATGNFGSNLLNNIHTNNLWCNRNGDGFNQLCTTNTGHLIFGSKIICNSGDYNSSCPTDLNLIPTQLPTNDSDGNSVCPEPINSSPSVSTNTSTTGYPFNYPTMTSLPSSFSVTPATPDLRLSTVFLPDQNSTSYSSISSITPAPIMSQLSSLTSPGASPSPTMLFCSEDGTWPMTPACSNATSTDCGNKSTLAKG